MLHFDNVHYTEMQNICRGKLCRGTGGKCVSGLINDPFSTVDLPCILCACIPYCAFYLFLDSNCCGKVGMEARRTRFFDAQDPGAKVGPKVPHVKLVDLKHWDNVQVQLTDETKELLDRKVMDSTLELLEVEGTICMYPVRW